MAIKRRWRGHRLGMANLPQGVRHAAVYADGYYLDQALLSTCGRWLKLTFDCGTTHYWQHPGEPTHNDQPCDWTFSAEGPVWPAEADPHHEAHG